VFISGTFVNDTGGTFESDTTGTFGVILSGSISIAFVIVFLLGLLIFKSKDISWIVLLGLYGADAILTIIHRIMLKENILKPHRKHMYQIRTNELKIPHLVVSGGYCVVQALIVVGFIVTESRYLYAISSAGKYKLFILDATSYFECCILLDYITFVKT